MAYTLAQYAKLEKNPLRKGVLIGLAKEGVIADLMSWRNISGLNEAGVRFDAVPTPAFIPLSGTIAEATVDGHQITHSVYRLAHHMDIPVPLEDSTADLIVPKPSAQQIKLALEGAAYVINDRFINGDQGSSPDGFNGINQLVSNMATTQTTDYLVGSTKTEIDLTLPYTSAAGQALITLVTKSMHAVAGHKPTAAFANSDFLLKFEEVIRRENQHGLAYDWVKAPLEVDDPRMSMSTASTKPMFKYRDVPFYDLGTLGDQTTKVILNTYTEGGSTGTGTRVFFVKQADDELEGIQNDPLRVRPIGLLEGSDTYRFRLTWTLGLALWKPRGIVKMEGVRVV